MEGRVLVNAETDNYANESSWSVFVLKSLHSKISN